MVHYAFLTFIVPKKKLEFPWHSLLKFRISRNTKTRIRTNVRYQPIPFLYQLSISTVYLHLSTYYPFIDGSSSTKTQRTRICTNKPTIYLQLLTYYSFIDWSSSTKSLKSEFVRINQLSIYILSIHWWIIINKNTKNANLHE